MSDSESDGCGLTPLESPKEFNNSNVYITFPGVLHCFIVQELCESRGGRPELSVLTSLLVSVDTSAGAPAFVSLHGLLAEAFATKKCCLPYSASTEKDRKQVCQSNRQAKKDWHGRPVELKDG